MPLLSFFLSSSLTMLTSLHLLLFLCCSFESSEYVLDGECFQRHDYLCGQWYLSQLSERYLSRYAFVVY